MAELQEVRVPDIGDFKDVEVIEVLVKPGDRVAAEDSLITLESDKATMEVPSPGDGIIREVRVKVGDRVSEGTAIAALEVEQVQEGAADEGTPKSRSEKAAAPADAAPGGQQRGEQPPPKAPAGNLPPEQPRRPSEPAAGERPPPHPPVQPGGPLPHASPAVRRFARELGVDLTGVRGSGPKGRILREDVQAHVKQAMQRGGGAGPGLPPMPEVDFSRFGEVEERPLTRVQQVSGANLHRNWVNIPHITQFGEADVTELEAFRKAENQRLERDGVRLSPLAFFVKAVVAALRQFPDFNSSLASGGKSLIRKKYYHVGVAVDTPHGLMVPVLRDADRKGVVQVAQELADLAKQARERKLGPEAMQGGCFSISSLGGIGGTHFTPIINAPEVAILGVSRVQPRLQRVDGEVKERLILPLSLSYDHRVIDGVAGARFIVYLGEVLSDVRRLVL